MNRPKQILKQLQQSYRTKPLLFVARVVVVLALIAVLATQRIFWTPDTLFFVFVIIFALFGQARAFIVRFLPLVLLITLYELFRGFADDLNGTVHVTEMIDFDRWMFAGQLPTVVLQQWWWDGSVKWYDFYFYFLYMIHFLMPVLLAIVIWKKSGSKRYWQFMWALVGLSFAAFVTYILYPAAPPWMASLDGYIAEPLHRVSTDVWWAMGVNDFAKLYDELPANQVAAIPSLHSAYPLLFSLFITRLYGMKRFWWIYVYPISMWIGVTYMGEHYVVDVLLGALYAALAYYASVAGYAWYYAPHRPIRLRIHAFMSRFKFAL